jgi:hypothetical protein
MINYLLLFSIFVANVNGNSGWFLKAHLDTITSDGPAKLSNGIISTSAIEYNTALSYTEEALYFTTNEPDWSKSSIMVSAFIEGQFTKPSRVKFGGMDYDAGDVHISEDGQYLYFSGKNINNRADGNIYRCQKTVNGWSTPEILPKEINSASQEAYPMTTASGNLYFGRLTSGSSYDIYVSKFVNGIYQEAEKLPETINTNRLELDAWVSPDESFMIFVSKDDTKGYGITDLYISFNLDNQWSKAINMGKRYNSVGVDGSPFLSKDSKYLFFTSTRDSYNPSRFDGGLDLYVTKFDINDWK